MQELQTMFWVHRHINVWYRNCDDIATKLRDKKVSLAFVENLMKIFEFTVFGANSDTKIKGPKNFRKFLVIFNGEKMTVKNILKLKSLVLSRRIKIYL